MLLALHVPYALALSILVGVLDRIPLVGSTVGGVIVALVALAAVSTTEALITVAYHVLYRVFEDYLLNPRVLRKPSTSARWSPSSRSCSAVHCSASPTP